MVSPPILIHPLLQLCHLPPLVYEVDETPVFIWPLFELFITVFAEESNACACVEHSDCPCHQLGAVRADFSYPLQWQMEESKLLLVIESPGGATALRMYVPYNQGAANCAWEHTHTATAMQSSRYSYYIQYVQ